MKNNIRFAALIAGFSLLSVPVMAQDSPVVGTWDTEAVTDFGTFGATMTVAGGDGGYTVEMVDEPMAGPGGETAPPMDATVSDVVVDGSAFSFKRSLTTPQGTMEIAYTGSVEGDSLTAEAATDFGTLPVTGTRVE